MPPKKACLMVPLDVNGSEYSTVKHYFEQTMSQAHQTVKIERVQNPELYKQYMIKKNAIEQRNDGIKIENERKLFHGCSGDVTEKICHQGFNRSFAGKNGKCLNLKLLKF